MLQCLAKHYKLKAKVTHIQVQLITRHFTIRVYFLVLECNEEQNNPLLLALCMCTQGSAG